MLARLLFAVLLVAVAPAARAQLIDTISYQGRLSDAGAAPEGAFEVRLELFDAPTGGAPLATETRPITFAAPDDGRFTVGDLPWGTLFRGQDRWIELAVRPVEDPPAEFVVLTPRQAVTATPVAAFARDADRAAVADLAPISLQDAYTFGRTIDAAPGMPVQIAGGAGLTVAGQPIEVLDAAGITPLASLSASSLALGATGAIVLDADASGDAAAVLPTGAITSAEIGDEPGVSAILRTGTGEVLGPLITPYATKQITVPAPGVIVASGVMQAFFIFKTGVTETVAASISTVTNDFSTPWIQQVSVPNSAPTGAYAKQLSLHGLFIAPAAGTYTLHVVATEFGGTADTQVTMGDTSLVLMYFPTVYGSIEGGEDLAAPGRSAATDDDEDPRRRLAQRRGVTERSLGRLTPAE